MWLINQMAEKPKERRKTHWIHNIDTSYCNIYRTYEAFVGKAALAGLVSVSEVEREL